METVGNGTQGLWPCHGLKRGSFFEHGRRETLGLETVVGKAGLVRDPLLVDVVVEAGEDAHDLEAAGVDTDVGAHGVEDVDGLCFFELPGAGGGLRSRVSFFDALCSWP